MTHLRAFLTEEQKRRPAVPSKARTKAAVKFFFRFLVAEERIVRRLRGAAPERAARARLGRCRPLAAAATREEDEGRPTADDPDPFGTRAALRRVLATRVPLTEQAVFVGVQGSRLHYTQLGRVFRHCVEAAGVNKRKRVTPHTLRHVFASELLRGGANLRQIQELLGLATSTSTRCRVG